MIVHITDPNNSDRKTVCGCKGLAYRHEIDSYHYFSSKWGNNLNGKTRYCKRCTSSTKLPLLLLAYTSGL